MITPGIFKAYDIRGMYPAELNNETALEIGRGLGRFFGKTGRAKVVVARDGRIGSPELYRAVIEGLRSANGKVRIVGIGLATTPMFYFLVAKLGCRGGIIVTASHNPKEYNGFNFMLKRRTLHYNNGLNKIVCSKGELRFRKSVDIKVTNRNIVPEKYWILDEKKIDKDLDAGLDIPGVKIKIDPIGSVAIYADKL